MHICLEIIPELLLAKQNLNTLLFALQLSASIIKKYPLPSRYVLISRFDSCQFPNSSLAIGRDIMQLIRTHPFLKYKKIAQTTQQVICETFPSLINDYLT